MNRKKIISAILAVSVCASAAMTGCGKSGTSASAPTLNVETIAGSDTQAAAESTAASSETATETASGDTYKSELTNEPISTSIKDQRPIAVIVDNESLALPHYGTADADIVYELMNSTLNGRITRLMCVVKDWENIKQLGSIRSTRPTNIPLAAEWNAVLCHDGGPFYIDDYLSRDYAAHFSGTFSRVSNGKSREYTEYIMPGDLDKNFKNSNYSTTYNDYYPGSHYQFADASSPVELDSAYKSSFEASNVTLPFSHNKSALKYNEKTQTYDYYEYGKAHKDGGTDKQLTFKNVLIQDCSFSQLDKNGYLVYNYLDKDEKGYYLTNGKGIKVTWTKASDTDPTRYYDGSGKEIKINTGKTYVTLIPEDSWSNVSFN